MSDDQEELLRLLEAQGQQFLQCFSLPQPMGSRGAKTVDSDADSEDEEWGGVGQSSSSEADDSERGEDGESDFEHEDDDFVAGSSTTAAPVVVFGATQSEEKPRLDKSAMRAFMSSKISKTRSDPNSSTSKKRKASESDEEDERTNVQNDAMLHKLVHTKLLSGSLSADLNLTGAERRKALEGRVLELTGGARLGKGEHTVRSGEHRKAAKRVREGLADKKRERQEKELEEAKNLGNYHPALKKLFDASSSGPPRKREQGMKMGVGKFKNGQLHLSREDIQKVTGPPPRGGKSRRGGRGSRR
ncbi:hypothetical protein NMY22_g3485 [Coprinellus aureogranulatus]|nr:hypothetical protein NMY22_g3485 [Coprinellus aureogranulatus]